MPIQELLEIIGAILFSLTGGAAVVFALSKWLGGVWAGRILENERSALVREQELLVRRRNVYAKLALNMRVFLSSEKPATAEQKQAFLAAYDEAALWAAEDVAAQLSVFLDLMVKHTAAPGSVTQPALQAAFVHCLTVMRKDCGFPNTAYVHRVVSF